MTDDRNRIAEQIRLVVGSQAAETVTLTLSAEDAWAMANDLDWCAHSTDRKYTATVRGGA